MTTSTKTVTRGDYEYVVSATRELRQVVINADGDMIATGKVELYSHTEIKVTKNGKFFDSGELQVFSEAYKASPSYANAFKKFPVGPSSRLGDMLLSAEATAQLEQAVREAESDVTTPEITAYVEHRKAVVAANMQAEREYEAHVNAVNRMMGLGEK